MVLKLSVDLDVCKGYALCMIESPNLFDVDDEAGKAILLEGHPSEEQRAEAEAAVHACPAKAIRLEGD